MLVISLITVHPFCIKYTHIALVQRVLKNLIGIDTFCAKSGVGPDIILAVGALVHYPPLTGGIGIQQEIKMLFAVLPETTCQ